MTSAIFLALVLVLSALVPGPAPAVTESECHAYLCLPAGFSTHGGTPANACEAPHRAVIDRIQRGLPALPSWSSCASQFGWDAANLSHNENHYDECPHGGTASGGTCRYTDSQGCTYSYAARQRVTVQVVVDGSSSFQPNYILNHTKRPAGTPTLDPPGQDPLFCRQQPTCQQLGTCPPPPGVCCPPQAVNYYWHGPATAPSKTLVCVPTPTSPQPPGDPPPQRAGEPYNPPNCCPPWALHHQWAYDRQSLTCVLSGLLPN